MSAGVSETAVVALVVVVGFALLVALRQRLRRTMTERDRGQALRPHFEGRWSHGQIAEHQGRPPAEIAAWFAAADADRAGG